MNRLLAGIVLVLFAYYPAFANERQPIKPKPKDKCPVCGMFTAKYPDFLAQIIFKDGSYITFDGSKDLFKYHIKLTSNNHTRKLAEVDSIYVKDYYNLKFIDAYTAYFVVGSDVFGPMGKELIPFKNEADAKVFNKDHKGKIIVKFEEVTEAVMKSLD